MTRTQHLAALARAMAAIEAHPAPGINITSTHIDSTGVDLHVGWEWFSREFALSNHDDKRCEDLIWRTVLADGVRWRAPRGVRR